MNRRTYRGLRLSLPFMLTASAAAWLASRPAAVSAAAGAEPVVDIFAARTWEPPPPPPPAPGAAALQPQQPPQPPPLPFRFFGRIVEPNQPVVYLLLEGDRIHRVRVGDTIGSAYRLFKSDSGRLFFRYKPMKTTQVLAIGGNAS